MFETFGVALCHFELTNEIFIDSDSTMIKLAFAISALLGVVISDLRRLHVATLAQDE